MDNTLIYKEQDTNIIKSNEFHYSKEELISKFKKVRAFTVAITEPLEIEDYVVQVTENASPAKWHLAHTTWFFETFLLEKELDDYDPVHPQYSYLFNSYYLQTGEPHCRARRGNISRPTVKQVFEYRESINEHVICLVEHSTEE